MYKSSVLVQLSSQRPLSITLFNPRVGGFSASSWMTGKGYSSPLTAAQTTELMEELEVLQYLLNTPCDSSSGIYASPINGWTKGHL